LRKILTNRSASSLFEKLRDATNLDGTAQAQTRQLGLEAAGRELADAARCQRDEPVLAQVPAHHL